MQTLPSRMVLTPLLLLLLVDRKTIDKLEVCEQPFSFPCIFKLIHHLEFHTCFLVLQGFVISVCRQTIGSLKTVGRLEKDLIIIWWWNHHRNVKVKWFWMVFTDVFYFTNLSNKQNHSIILTKLHDFPYSQFIANI